MSHDAGFHDGERFGVVRYADHYEVIDKRADNLCVSKVRSQIKAHELAHLYSVAAATLARSPEPTTAEVLDRAETALRTERDALVERMRELP